jgi:hypothetical protein
MRQRNWRKPAGAVNCTRPSKYGNPWRVGPAMPLARSLTLFREWAEARAAAVQADLRGKDLMCYCGLDKPCHVDILLEIANRKAAA